MNRALVYVGLGVVLAGISAIASPIVLTGRETLTLAVLAGLVLAPVGLVVIAIAAASFDPRRTTVHGTFGGDDGPTSPSHAAPHVAAHLPNPKAPVRCLNCRTMVTYDLARCPRCAEDRPCRVCSRPLTTIEDRAACPGCRRPELFCNCSQYGAPVRPAGLAGRGRVR